MKHKVLILFLGLISSVACRRENSAPVPDPHSIETEPTFIQDSVQTLDVGVFKSSGVIFRNTAFPLDDDVPCYSRSQANNF